VEAAVDPIHIRHAVSADAVAIAQVYNHYIQTSTATFDTEIKSTEERAAWIGGRPAEHPVLVVEQHGAVVAWGALSPLGERRAYRHSVEISAYVADGVTRQGVGPALAQALIDEAQRIGHHAIVARIVADNEHSLKMSLRLGFVEVGRMREVGYKFGRWLDLVLLELILDTPAPGETE
jgi:phosphinothricin acetyltransferase